ncbi:PREDICTED: uncharacterized protein C7orf31 homolog, partial [Phaethon lepturus]|uniref:uncharacterized protein C7orf31 homolog n=1 Tax=Phaethon lepturus TaxID=97097 RepID=UPI000530A1C4
MMLLHDLPHYYREIEGTEILSRTFESNEVLTPLQIPSRPTVSQDRYKEFRESFHSCKLPWRAEREHGRIALPVLPEDHKAKDKSPCTFVKGYQHYGSGVDPWPRGLSTEQYCDVTQLKKSDMCMNDELLRKPPDSLAKPLCLPFPTSHPYQTHISRYAMFPNFKSPEDRDTGIDASSHQPFHPNIPTKAFDMVVLRKTRGNPYRHEAVSIPSASQKAALHWPGQHTYFQLPKFLEHNLSPRTTNMLQNTERALGITTYSRDFTGRGPMNPHILDNYYMKAVGRLTGQLGEDVELKETFLPSLSQVRPLEGRTARLLQGRRPHESILQEQHSSKQATLSQTCYQKVHYLDTRPRINKLQKITDTLQTEALCRGQLSERPELESLLKSACSLSYEDFKPRHLDQRTVWENPVNLNKPGLPLDAKSEESRILLHKLWHQEACQSAWRPKDGPRETALPEWIPTCEAPHRQTALLELQHSFSKTAAQKLFHDFVTGETKDLRDNITE